MAVRSAGGCQKLMTEGPRDGPCEPVRSRTVPGPTSTYVVMPSDARRPPTHRPPRRTGEDTLRDQRPPLRSGGAPCAWVRRQTVGDHRHTRIPGTLRRARNFPAARPGPGGVHEPRSGRARWTGSRDDPRRAELPLARLAGPGDGPSRAPAMTTCPAPFRFAGLTTSALRRAVLAGLRERCRRRAPAPPPNRTHPPRAPPSLHVTGPRRRTSAKRVGERQSCRRRRARSIRRGLWRRTSAGCQSLRTSSSPAMPAVLTARNRRPAYSR